jgi:hypothetical protein
MRVGRCPVCGWWFVCVPVSQNRETVDAAGRPIRVFDGQRHVIRRHQPCPPRQIPEGMTDYGTRLVLVRDRRVVTPMDVEEEM